MEMAAGKTGRACSQMFTRACLCIFLRIHIKICAFHI
jgi:hypothetical protein